MKKVRFFLFFVCSLTLFAADLMAQENLKEKVVVMRRDYTYEDPRWSTPVVLEKGEAISVIDASAKEYEYWPYPAAEVHIPKCVTRLPGAAGEHYLVLNGTHVRLREGPSTNYGYYCVNLENTSSVYHNQFVNDSNKPGTDAWGLTAEWEPYYLPKGTHLPYLGKQAGFYKTKFNGTVFYVSAKYCLYR